MNRFLVFVFVLAVGLFVFNQKNPAKFEQLVTRPAIDLKAAIRNFSHTDKKEKFDAERLRIMDKYSSLLEKYKEPLAKLEKQKNELSKIINPDLTARENLAEINKKIEQKKEEYLAKKAEIEEQISDLEKRYNDIKNSIENFQNSIQKIKDGIKQGQESIDSFSTAINPS